MAVRVAVVSPVIARYDAVSTAVRDTIRAFSADAGFETSALTLRSDFPALGAHVVVSASTLRRHRAFRQADLLIYHFAVYSPLFDAFPDGNGHVRQVAVFHNITPAEFVAPDARALIERSLRQLRILDHADRIWAVSATNADALAAHGVDAAKVEVIPLAVERPEPASLASKPAPPVELLFVGRMVPSKGVLDLVEAAALLRARTATPFRLRLAGNVEYSDPAYVASVKSTIAAHGLSDHADVLGAVDDARLAELYRAAHILAVPSYHEGFCVPVVEGLRAGCIPIGYAAYNLPAIANRLGRLVPVGDRTALARALGEVIEAISGPGAERLLPLDFGLLSPSAFDRAAQDYVRTFAFDRVAGLMVASARRLLGGS